MAVVLENREWVLSAYAPEGLPTSDHLKLRNSTFSLDAIPDQHVAIQLLWVSIDPYLRSQMTGHDDGLRIPQFPLNQVVRAYGIGRVIRSKKSDYNEGDIVVNPFCPISEYSVVPPQFLIKVDPMDAIASPDYLSCLGIAGLTAWVGIDVLGDPNPGCNVFISAAAGGVGLLAGQLAKLKGCRVIGSTGTDEKNDKFFTRCHYFINTHLADFSWNDSKLQVEKLTHDFKSSKRQPSLADATANNKVKLLKEEFGYDDAFNYHKETDFDAALAKYFPNGIDIYLDNVGGKMLEAVLNHVNTGARIPICGMISQYNTVWTGREGVRNLLNLVGKEVRMQGFMCGSYLNRMPEFSEQMKSYIKQGKIKSKHTIYHGIESFLESLASLFSSSNVGKAVIQVTL